jgi:protease IV
MKRIGKILLWLIAVFVVLEVVGLGIRYASRRIPANTVLTIPVEGLIQEQPTKGVLSSLVAGPPLTVTDIVEGLDRARTDPRITGVIVRASESTMNMAKMQEIREKIREFNRSGKFTVAHLEFATNGPYYLASACQTIIQLPKSMLYVRGMMASSTFYRGTLDKLGIVPDLLHTGDYKNAINIYTEKKYTPAHREATKVLLEDWYGEYVRGVAEARGLKPEEVQTAFAQGPFNSEEAMAAKLVDRLGYEDEVSAFVRQKNHGSDNRLSLREYLRRTEREEEQKMAVIYATGTIVPGRGGDEMFGETLMGAETMAEQFRHVREDDSLKAVVFRIDSPGGSVTASEVIRREVELTRRVKPVVVSMSDVAASGGYWIALPAHKIVAQPGTITGSIGVITGKFNLQGLYAKLGLSKDFVATTDNATLDYLFQNFTPAQRESVQKYMFGIYQDFIGLVAKSRGMKVEDVDCIGQGRVWTGERARQLGLVDELGGLDTAIAAAKELAKIPKSEKVGLVYLPPPKSLVERILSLTDDASFDGRITSPRAWLARLESMAREPAWALMPDVPQVQ